MAKKITMDAELLVELLGKRGFVLDANNNLQYICGSISNYTKMLICQPRNMCSLAHGEEYVPACFVQYESFQEPGYIECDWKRTEEGYVAVNNLLKYLNEKGIRNSDEVKREREERMKRRQELRAKKQAIIDAMYAND